MSQSDDLKKLLKAFEKRAHTSEGLDPWQELLSRRQTVASSKSAEAAEALQGFLGSWASAYGNEPLVKTSGGEERPEPSIPVPTTIVESRLGKSGLPEINFVPYSHRTNREGSKGPALLGHPISFSVVGPTLKDSSCDWQWEATDNSGIPGTGDYLTYDTTITGAPGPAAFEDGYGITSIPDDGLYLFISALGDTDGLIYTGGGRVALSEVYPGVSKSEIFRVVEISGNQLILDPGKRLVDYFNFLGNINIIRAVTIIKPKVSRLVPLPSGGPAGSERTFAVVSPESAANTDLLPPFDFGTS